MSYVQDQRPAATQAQINVTNVSETTGAGPINATGEKATYSYTKRRVSLRSRLDKVGYWIIVAAGLAVLLLVLGFFLPKLTGAVSTAFFAGIFVSMLTSLNLPKPAAWGNSLLGRKIFPVIAAPEQDILRLAWINGLLVFIFTFVFQFIASFIGPFLGGLIVFAALIAAAVFFSRARSVIFKP
jgi:hypothetical protein